MLGMKLLVAIRRPALGWPLAISQEERLSYGIGSPWVLGGLKISLSLVCLIRSASIASCRLVGESLLEEWCVVMKCLKQKLVG